MRGDSVYKDKRRNRWRIEFVYNGRRYSKIAFNRNGEPASNRDDAVRAAARFKDSIEFPETMVTANTSAVATGSKRPRPRHEMLAPAASTCVQALGNAVGPSEYKLSEAVVAYGAASAGLKSWRTIQGYLATILNFYGADVPLSSIDEVKIEEFRNWLASSPIVDYRGGVVPPEASRLNEMYRPRVRKTGDTMSTASVEDQRGALVEYETRSPSTVRKYLKALRAVMVAASNKTDPNDPYQRPYLRSVPAFKKLRDPKGTPRPFPVGQLNAVLKQLPAHARAVVLGAVLTGWRRGQVCSAQIDWLSDERQALRHDAFNKGNREGWTPLSPSGYALFVKLREHAEAIGSRYFINYFDPSIKRWRPVKNIERTWLRALEVVGLRGKHRFHDLKAMVLTTMAKGGIDPKTVQMIGQHADIETTMAHYIDADILSGRTGQDVVEQRLRDVGIDLAAQISMATIVLPQSDGLAGPKSHTESHTPATVEFQPDAETAAKSLKKLARPARLERATFSFGG